ncbi:hypothetical protein ACO0QE_003180 [Hanseniaspora vineae]
MPVAVNPIKLKSIVQTGIKQYIPACRKITIQYCNWGGSSEGIRQYLKSGQINKLLENNKHIEFEIVNKNGTHPVITGHYANQRIKPICIRNLTGSRIEEKLNVIKSSSGSKLRNVAKNKNVQSNSESVRGIWSPVHVDPSSRYRV